MTEKSGIELLKDLLEKFSLLEKKVDQIDRNLKILINNKAVAAQPALKQSEKIIKDVKQSIDNARANSGFKNFKLEVSDASKAGTNNVLANKQRGQKNIVVKGKIVSSSEGSLVPLISVNVKIFNDKDVLVKETKTNRAGHWVSHLPPGKYVALFDGDVGGKKLLPQNRNFIVPEQLPEGMTEIEVS